MKPLHYTACGLDDVWLANGFSWETVDGEDYLTVEDLDGLWKMIGLRLVTSAKTLAPKEIRFLRSHMELTQAELAARLRVSDQTVARWEKGETGIGAADVALRALFLANRVAQPEGNKQLEKLTELCDEIVAGDEPASREVMFRHSGTWRQQSAA